MTPNNKSGGFIRLRKDLLDSPAWRTAPPGMKCLVLAIWRRHNGRNNGEISFANREARVELGCGPNQARRFFDEAESRGFLVAVRRGSFDMKNGARANRATIWRITMENFKGRPATDDWQNWTAPKEHSTVSGAITVRYPER